MRIPDIPACPGNFLTRASKVKSELVRWTAHVLFPAETGRPSFSFPPPQFCNFHFLGWAERKGNFFRAKAEKRLIKKISLWGPVCFPGFSKDKTFIRTNYVAMSDRISHVISRGIISIERCTYVLYNTIQYMYWKTAKR